MPPKQYRTAKGGSSTTIMDTRKMGTYLVIVESPSKCAKIEEYLGIQYTCIASKGHFRYIEGLKKIDSKKNYTIEFSIVEEKRSHVKMMDVIISKYPVENVYLATDDDREGEAIAWHICDVFGLSVKTTKRILFHEITRPAIQHAIQNPTTVNMSLVQAQHTRQVLDILLGFKISPVLWKHIQNDKQTGLSAGRCQTPALRLVYENEEKRSNAATAEMNYKVIGYFTAKNIPFQLCSVIPSVEEVIAFFDKTKKWTHVLSFSESKQTTKSAPAPFTTSKLLQVASNVLHFSPKTTMELCQSLYQSGLITYMRTDSTKYSPVFLATAREYITRKLEKPDFVGNLEKIATNEKQENPHEAIRCTNIYTDNYSGSANPLLSKMYKLIWKNTVESCMSTAVYNQTNAMISAPDDKTYTHVIEVPVHLGWKYLSYNSFHKDDIKCDSDDDEDGAGGEGSTTLNGKKSLTEIQNNGSAILFYLQSFPKNQPVEYGYIETTMTAGRNKYPLYTEASLIQTLEDLGIGRPSTFASIVETVVERGYVKKMNVPGKVVKCEEHKLYADGTFQTLKKEKVFGEEKGKLVIQPVGTITIQFLLEHFLSLFEYGFTKQMEESLDNIENEREKYTEKYVEVCREFNRQVKELLKPIAKMDRQEWAIDDTYRLSFSRHGPVLKKLEEDGTVSFKSIRKNVEIDMEKLKSGGYTVDELIERDINLGVYDGETLLLKNGKFGPYVECGDKKISIKTLVKSFDKIEYADVLPYLQAAFEKECVASSAGPKSPTSAMKMGNTSVLRIITNNLSIRKGKFGPYLFYQTQYMNKPQFLNLKKFPDNYHNCSPETIVAWVKQTYEVDA